MKPLLLILTKSLKNGFKQLIKKPAALIGYIFFIGLMGLSFLGMASDNEKLKGSSDIYVSIMTVLSFLSVIPSLLQGMSSLGVNLKNADVNLVFTSPVSPGRILLYSQLRQTGAALYVGIIMLLQAPILKMFFGFTFEGMVIYVIAWIIMLITPTLLSMFMYVVFRHHQRGQIAVKSCIYTLLAAYFVWTVYSMLNAENPLNGLLSALSADFVKFAPILGWYRHLFASAVQGFTFDFFWSLAAILLTSILAGRYAMKTAGIDYYEDAAGMAEKIEKAMAAARKGESSAEVMRNRKSKIKKVNHHFTLHGAGAIYQKHMLEYRKKGLFLFNFRTLYMTILPLTAAYFLSSSDETPDLSAIIALGASVYITFIVAFQGRWTKELQKPYIYLIPDNPFRKLLLSVSAEMLKHLLDGTILFLACSVIMGSSLLVCLLCAIAYMIINSMYCFMDILSQRIFGKLHSKILGTYLKVMLSILVILPGVVTVAVMLDAQLSAVLSMVVLNLINLCIAVVIALLAMSAFKHPEVNQ